VSFFKSLRRLKRPMPKQDTSSQLTNTNHQSSSKNKDEEENAEPKDDGKPVTLNASDDVSPDDNTTAELLISEAFDGKAVSRRVSFAAIHDSADAEENNPTQ
jgi:hypothetical protein